MAARQSARSLPKQIWQLGWISFFADICSEMAYPILALFVVAIGSGPAALGIVEGIAESIVSFMKGASGVHSDITGKRVPYIRAGYGLSALGKPVIALAAMLGWPMILAGRSLDRFGKGIRTTARDTLIVESVEKERRGAAFGLQRALDSAGAFSGVLLTLAILYAFHNVDPKRLYANIFLFAFIPGLVSIYFTFRLRETASDERPLSDAAGEPRPRISLKNMPTGYWKAVTITTVFAVANSSDTFLILRANDVFAKAYPGSNAAILAIWAYALYNVVYTFVSYPAGELSDRIGRWKILGAGWAIYALIYAGFAFATAPILWILFAIYGIYIGATDGVGKALVGDFAPKHAKGTAMGVFYMITGFATLLASGLTGILWSAYGPTYAFGFGSAMAVVSVVLVLVFSGEMGRQKKV